MNPRDEHFAVQFSEQRAAAEAHLWRQMEARGMHARDGWKITEVMRDTRGGTELVLRPLHLWHATPPDLECVVWVRNDDGAVDASCTPEPMRRPDRLPT